IFVSTTSRFLELVSDLYRRPYLFLFPKLCSAISHTWYFIGMLQLLSMHFCISLRLYNIKPVETWRSEGEEDLLKSIFWDA
ncbi:hypothetical protein L9F63_008163, partial [Diploptera punctata]